MHAALVLAMLGIDLPSPRRREEEKSRPGPRLDSLPMGEEAEDAHYEKLAAFNSGVKRDQVATMDFASAYSRPHCPEQAVAEEKRERKRAARLAGKR